MTPPLILNFKECHLASDRDIGTNVSAIPLCRRASPLQCLPSIVHGGRVARRVPLGRYSGALNRYLPD